MIRPARSLGSNAEPPKFMKLSIGASCYTTELWIQTQQDSAGSKALYICRKLPCSAFWAQHLYTLEVAESDNLCAGGVCPPGGCGGGRWRVWRGTFPRGTHALGWARRGIQWPRPGRPSRRAGPWGFWRPKVSAILSLDFWRAQQWCERLFMSLQCLASKFFVICLCKRAQAGYMGMAINLAWLWHGVWESGGMVSPYWQMPFSC